MNAETVFSKARLYVLIDAFERDIRAILQRYVLTEMNEEEALGPSFARADQRRQEDEDESEELSALHYLDLREGYDLLNRHRELLPSSLAREVRELTSGLDRLIPVRKRVMHARPLRAGDADVVALHLEQYTSRFWTETRRILTQLASNPDWEPVVDYDTSSDRTLHNLPRAEYDDTGLIGREAEVQDVLQLIKRKREPVITITGEGGIGKTALALEAAWMLIDDTDAPFDAVLWTSLKHERLTAHGIRVIEGATLDVLSASVPLGRALDDDFAGSLAELAEILMGFEVLIVIDNLETIGGSEFNLLYDTLPATVRYLITSRIGVGEFERRYPLGALSSNDAMRLFSDLVRARRMERLIRLSSDARRQLVEGLRNSPMAIRWWVLAVEAGRDPGDLWHKQDELLEFCVRSVYEALSDTARAVLATLHVVGRPATPDEVIYLLDESNDSVQQGLQELIRGALVSRNTESVSGSFVSRIELTATATQFMSRPDVLDSRIRSEISRRDEHYRELEERRKLEAADRSLNPNVVRTVHEHQSPAAQVLRRAMRHFREGNREAAFSDVERARSMNPDFYEVDRVMAYLLSRSGSVDEASIAYERALAASDDYGRGFLCHFYAGHLANKVRDIERAIQLEKEAYQQLPTPDVAVTLGYYLVRNLQFEEGLALIRPVAEAATGRLRLIAINNLAQGYRRWGEYLGQSERNPLLQYDRAKTAAEIASAALDAGVSDSKIRDTVLESACTSLHGAASATTNGLDVPGLSNFLDTLQRQLVRCSDSEHWATLSGALARLARAGVTLPSLYRLHDAYRLADSAAPDLRVGMGGRMIGKVLTVVNGQYGFLAHPDFPRNLFFHKSDLQGCVMAALDVGTSVSFSFYEGDKGPHATEIELCP